MVLLLFIIVVVLSNGILNESIPIILKKMIRWFGFTILGAPQLNGIENTSIIISGVTWSLPFEWFFYLSLPLMALMLGIKVPIIFIGFSIVCVIYFEIWQPYIYYVAFFGGITTSFLVRSRRFSDFASGRISSLIIVGCFFCCCQLISYDI